MMIGSSGGIKMLTVLRRKSWTMETLGHFAYFRCSLIRALCVSEKQLSDIEACSDTMARIQDECNRVFFSSCRVEDDAKGGFLLGLKMQLDEIYGSGASGIDGLRSES